MYKRWLAINLRRALASLTSFCASSKAQTEAKDDVRPIFTQVMLNESKIMHICIWADSY